MSNPVISVAPDEPIEVAARLMVKNRVGALPVVEGCRRIGIITETNLLRHICQARPAPRRRVHRGVVSVNLTSLA
jgi:CBS domain-containing protein